MTPIIDCNQNRDDLKLVREGTGQDQRLSPALDPAYAPVDEHGVAHHIVFAQAYSDLLKYFDLDDTPAGTWKPFFSTDLSVQLAVAAVQDVNLYRATIKEYFDFLKDLSPTSDLNRAKDSLGFLFSIAGTVAKQLDVLKDALPEDNIFRTSLQNSIRSQLAPAFRRLIAYYKADLASAPNTLVADVQPDLTILGATTRPFSRLFPDGLARDWITDGSADWTAYTAGIAEDASVFGSGATELERINHIATHNLFTSIFDLLLRSYARIVSDADRALQETFTKYDRHEPHYTLFLAFLRLLEEARKEANTLTARHLDFYYREILRLKEKPPEPAKAHLLVELAKQAAAHEFPPGELFNAGKDDLGVDAFFANDRDFVANQGEVAELKSVYRHGDEKVGMTSPTTIHEGRVYASPVANSDDGLGGELISPDQSWHPFHNKRYQDGKLAQIRMPEAELGFAIASHHFLLAEGKRTVTVFFPGTTAGFTGDHSGDLVCSFTGEKGWIELQAKAAQFTAQSGGLKLDLVLTGADPGVVPYSQKIHGYAFATNLPILLVKLRHRSEKYFYNTLQDAQVATVEVTVKVEDLRTLAVSNDFGPVDLSKPFQPFGPSPDKESALIVGSKELFQKHFSTVTVKVQWQSTPAPFNNKAVTVSAGYLQAGTWHSYTSEKKSVTESAFFGEPPSGTPPYIDAPDLTEPEQYGSSSRHGFIRLKLDDGFGQREFQDALIAYIKSVTDSDTSNDLPKPSPPVAPVITRLTADYTATQAIVLDSASKGLFENRQSYFFHVAPFGNAEQHPYLKAVTTTTGTPVPDKNIYLLPQLKHQNELDESLPKGETVRHEGEFFVGITDLIPPQNLALLFEVADGTADPLAKKPRPHIQWSYLRNNEWIPFASSDVEDATSELLKSGIITFSVPRDASDNNTLLPAGMHWIRGAVAKKSDAVCRLIQVAAQALQATFMNKGNDPAFPAKVLPPGTISKLDQPDADVKKISQPFPTFGGRGQEKPAAFYTRVSERLRHKDRAIALWDYERLVLEAFPQVYRAKCLNHTHYDSDETGKGIYRELAPGHVTIVTIPNQHFPSLRDPLKPYTSLGLLDEIASFLATRTSCFVTLHVKNPQFEEARVSCKVRFYPGFDESFYTNRLKEAITRFLSPWAFADGGAPSFGGKIYKSVLIDFVEELPYVDYVTDFLLFHKFQDLNGGDVIEEGDEITGSKAVSILVSAREHTIAVLKPAAEETPGEICPSPA